MLDRHVRFLILSERKKNTIRIIYKYYLYTSFVHVHVAGIYFICMILQEWEGEGRARRFIRGPRKRRNRCINITIITTLGSGARFKSCPSAKAHALAAQSEVEIVAAVVVNQQIYIKLHIHTHSHNIQYTHI